MTWLSTAGTGFGPDNLPYGVFSTAGTAPRTGVAIGTFVLDLAAATDDPVHATRSLNAFMARGLGAWSAVRAQLTQWFTDETHRAAVEPHMLSRDELTLHLPVEVAGYVDFYSSQHHAENLGWMFRPGSAPLAPNSKHLPIGYHGRSGTVRVSGTPVIRPRGQRTPSVGDTPGFGPSQRLDIEADVGFVVGMPSALGTPVPLSAFPDQVFGACLVNDWSARDIQSWEYVTLGSYLGKSFVTSVSPWIVPLAALEAARVASPPRDVPIRPYLDDTGHAWGLDLTLEVRLKGELLSRPPFGQLYWTRPSSSRTPRLTAPHCAPATCTPRAPSRTRPRPARLADRTLVERAGAADPF